MASRKAAHQSDIELFEIIEQPGVWIIHSGVGVRGVATTLRRAIDKADTVTKSGTPVVAIARPPPHRLFVFQDQITRLAKLVKEREIRVGTDREQEDPTPDQI